MRGHHHTSWSEYRHDFLQDFASSPRSPVLLHGAQLRCDVISEGEELTPHSSTQRYDSPLFFLRQQRHLLTLVREFVVHQMQVLEYYRTVEETPLSGLEAVCLGLQELCHNGALLQKKVRANQLLRPFSPPLHGCLSNLQRMLQLMSVKAAIVTEKLLLSALHTAPHFPTEFSGSLCRSLSTYNKVLAEMLRWDTVLLWTHLQPVSITRVVKVIAEERGWLLAGHFLNDGLGHRLEDVVKGEVKSQQVGGALSSLLKRLVWEDQCQTAPLLRSLVSLDHMAWSGMDGQSMAESLLYEQYCSHLWPLLSANLFQTSYPGAMSALIAAGVGERITDAIQFLQSVLTSDVVPEQCRESVHCHGHHLLHTMAFMSWDTGMCQSLGLALTDKCVLLDDGAHRTHSRTSAALVTVCQELLVLLHTLRSDDTSRHQCVLSCCVTTLQLCELWLRSRSQIYSSSGSVGHLLLISHGDLPVIKEQMHNVIMAVHNLEWPPVSQRLCVKLQDVSDSLEGVALSLPRLLQSICALQAQEIFQHMMPSGRHWRGKVANGLELVPSDYAQAAVNTVLVPVLEVVRTLGVEEQLSAVALTIGVFMEAWMGHILRERLRFSLQGALQLRCDFESVREVLKSQELSPVVVQSAVSLPVFQQADNAIECLLRQPSHKSALQSGGCSLFCCPPLCHGAVESVSDSLQSLDSLGRRGWAHSYPAHQPRHSHDSYLPHNQPQWLSLRLHKTGNR
ncbi:coiled-coil domain-containing protein 142 isoform 2-T2 [Leptodactylus fuscus]|uniref:coiled-coil domain-containing protein 142 isoform X1 n=2 Tax=Leptodactylus fuscus TaxID=238119 RepID=UPI003F4EC90C